MKRKRILLSLMTIALVCVLIGAGIFAYFSDIETVPATFTTGTLNLKVGANDPCTENISIGGLKPGDTSNAGTWLTRNDGSISGNLTVAIGAITNNENTLTEPEAAASDLGEPGELGANLKVAFWMDVDKSGGWNSGDYYLKSDGTKVAWVSGSTLPTAAYDTVDSYASKTWTDCQNVAASTDLGNFRVEYDLPSGTGNTVQSDSCSFTITFTLNQA
ncbi:MAG: CalY family protein [Dehalococcoidia bacterium]|nr:CalY family protein [Dehalococcoidia bacterium]